MNPNAMRKLVFQILFCVIYMIALPLRAEKVEKVYFTSNMTKANSGNYTYYGTLTYMDDSIRLVLFTRQNRPYLSETYRVYTNKVKMKQGNQTYFNPLTGNISRSERIDLDNHTYALSQYNLAGKLTSTLYEDSVKRYTELHEYHSGIDGIVHSQKVKQIVQWDTLQSFVGYNEAGTQLHTYRLANGKLISERRFDESGKCYYRFPYRAVDTCWVDSVFRAVPPLKAAKYVVYEKQSADSLLATVYDLIGRRIRSGYYRGVRHGKYAFYDHVSVYYPDGSDSVFYSFDGVGGISKRTMYALDHQELKDDLYPESVSVQDFLFFPVNAGKSMNVMSEKQTTQPKFPGGDQALLRFLGEHIRYPREAQENGIQGKVVLRFVVEMDGSISNVEEVQSPASILTEEAIRVVKMMPKWTPGYIEQTPVRVAYVLPVVFR
jgi:TonB family protein